MTKHGNNCLQKEMNSCLLVLGVNEGCIISSFPFCLINTFFVRMGDKRSFPRRIERNVNVYFYNYYFIPLLRLFFLIYEARSYKEKQYIICLT